MSVTEIVINKNYCDVSPMEFGYEACLPSHYFGPVVRGYWLLHYVVSGKGSFVREGQIHEIGAGQIFVIPPYVDTSYQADENDPWEYIWIGFDSESVAGTVFTEHVMTVAGAGKIFRDMIRCSEMDNGRSPFLCAKILELISLILDGTDNPPDHIDKALNYIQADYANGITVSTVAERLNLDRTYFSVLFKKRLGISPIKYLSDLRLEKAAELIVKHGMSPTTAALSVGYADYCHFSRAFRKNFGKSPKEYAKHYVNEKTDRFSAK